MRLVDKIRYISVILSQKRNLNLNRENHQAQWSNLVILSVIYANIYSYFFYKNSK